MTHILAVDLDEVLSESLDEVLKFHDYKINGIPVQKSDISNYYIFESSEYEMTVEEGVKYFSEVLYSDAHKGIQPVV